MLHPLLLLLIRNVIISVKGLFSIKGICVVQLIQTGTILLPRYSMVWFKYVMVEWQVLKLVEMGFDEALVIAALRDADGDENRALERLLGA